MVDGLNGFMLPPRNVPAEDRFNMDKINKKLMDVLGVSTK